jgi:ubiquinone/menaquinone biosynthesis C-methylase UbiE
MRHRHPIIAAIYDRMCAAQQRAFLAALRGEIVGNAAGIVVEVGAGTGLNFPHYRAASVQRLAAVEPDPYMRRRAERRAQEAGLAVTFVDATAEGLPFPASYADNVVATLMLCSVDQPEQVAGEFRRVLKPGGALLFIEHVRSEEPWRARLQDWVTPVWRRFAGNCHANRASVAVLQRSGFVVQELRRVPGGPWGNAFVAGIAQIGGGDGTT